MDKNIKNISLVVAVLLIVLAIGVLSPNNAPETNIKIGIVTPLTGATAYWGESTSLGASLASTDLAKEGIKTQFIIEDSQLDPKVALNAAQKLVNVDKVHAIYSEFNPAAITVASFLKDKNILHVYDAAAISPLEGNINTYKSYLDYETSCKKVAELMKSRGMERVGVLKLNLEFGDLCLKGIKSVYGDKAFVEEYNAGENDFRSPLSKLKAKNIKVLFNVSFQTETFASLKQAKELKMDAIFSGLSEVVSPDLIKDYSKTLEGSVMFGLPVVSEDFVTRIKKEFPDKTIGNYQALALAYIHLKQIAHALNKCGEDLVCTRKEMGSSKPESSAGFAGFKNHVASFNTLIQEWRSGKFVDIQK
jgi:branched-chain amino acid transport system substrate-binding protein